MSTTKVGATLREYREEAFESTIVPMYRELASELTHQLLRDFMSSPDWRCVFDLTKVRVLQDDENRKAERIRGLVTDGVISVAEGRRILGWTVTTEHDVYLRRKSTMVVPTGLDPEEQATRSNAATMPANLTGFPADAYEVILGATELLK